MPDRRERAEQRPGRRLAPVAAAGERRDRRADENGRNKDLYAVIDRCQRNGITRFSLRTEPPVKR